MPTTSLSWGNALPAELRREAYFASGGVAWIRTAEFSALSDYAGEFLHTEELATFGALKMERRRASYLLGRYTAKRALETCCGARFPASEIQIASGVFNQPVVHYSGSRPYGVSISHSERVVCSVAYPEEHPMAIDVEELDASRTHVMLTQMGEAEIEQARSVCGSPDLAATVVWSAKEAVSKALRCGMTCPFEVLETCGMDAHAGGYVGYFKNFAQYKFQSWSRGTSVVTMVLPKKTELGLSFPDTL